MPKNIISMATGLKSASWLASPRTKVLAVSAIVIALAVFLEFNETFQVPVPNLVDLKVLLLSLPAFLVEQYQVVAAGLAIGAAIILLIWKWPAGKRVEKTAKEIPIREVTETDIKKTLKAVDALLEKLPDAEIKKFSKTKEAVLYKSVMKKFGVR
jgi:hypothetical protein